MKLNRFFLFYVLILVIYFSAQLTAQTIAPDYSGWQSVLHVLPCQLKGQEVNLLLEVFTKDKKRTEEAHVLKDEHYMPWLLFYYSNTSTSYLFENKNDEWLFVTDNKRAGSIKKFLMDRYQLEIP